MSSLTIDPRLQARRIEVLRLRGRRRLRVLATMLTLAVVAALGWWLVKMSPVLDVDAVRIEGTVQTDASAVLQAAGVEVGQPLVEVDVSAARDAIVALPWVASVTSDRDWSGDVTFDVVERTAVAVVPGESGWLLVDARGRVLDTRATVPADVVVVDGSTWAVSPGGWVGEGALPALDIAALLPEGLRSSVASIDASDGALDLVLFGGGRVLLGDATELDQKFLSALTLLRRIDQRCVDRVDVRAPAVPVLTRLTGCS